MNERPCSKCGVPKAPSEFYADKSRKDDKNSQCKACLKLYRQEYRKGPKFKTYIREYRQRPKRKKYAREYNQEYYLRVTKVKRKAEREKGNE